MPKKPATATALCRRLIAEILSRHPDGLKAGEIRRRILAHEGPAGAVPRALQQMKIDQLVEYQLDGSWRLPGRACSSGARPAPEPLPDYLEIPTMPIARDPKPARRHAVDEPLIVFALRPTVELTHAEFELFTPEEMQQLMMSAKTLIDAQTRVERARREPAA
jgi:hypothetical protein